MPLMKSRSKKAFSKNVAAEMHAGKPQPQALAIAYSVKRKAKKASGGTVESGSRDMNMSEGGAISAKTEKRPMPDDVHDDSDETRRNRGDKPSKQDTWTDMPTVAQAQKPSRTPLKHPKMAPQSQYTVRLRDQEDDLEMTAKPNNGPQHQPPKEDDEEGADRQGPKSRDLDMKMMANGGEIEDGPDHQAKRHNKAEDDEYGDGAEEDNLEEPAGLTEDDDEETQPVDEFMSTNRMAPMLAEGGHIEHEGMDSYDDDGHEDSIASAIMARRNRLHSEIDSGAHDEDLAAMDMMAEGGKVVGQGEGYKIIRDKHGNDKHVWKDEPEHAKYFADGGEINGEDSIYSDDSDQADLSRNAEEDANMEDRSSYDSLRKENYSESEGLAKLDNPKSSGQKGDKREDDEENEHDMISSIRSKMNQRRQFKQR